MLAAAKRKAIGMLQELRSECERPGTEMVISGCLGPRGDGYQAKARMGTREAHEYRAAQIETFARTGADMVAAFIMNYAEEVIGIANAARASAMPVTISFTLETDGRLPSGQGLEDAIIETDRATSGYPAYYMINCAHPTRFERVLQAGGRWRERLRGLRANASKRSHAELDESPDLDAGDPQELAAQYRACGKRCPGSRSWAAAAAPITGT